MLIKIYHVSAPPDEPKNSFLPDRQTDFYKKEKLLKWRPVLFVSAILFLILIIGKCSYAVFYSSPGWKEYEKINIALTEIRDYAGIPDYAEVQSVLEKYNVTEKQYAALQQNTRLEKNLSGDCLSEIADIAQAQHTSPSLTQVFSELVGSYISRDYWYLNLLLLAVWFIFVACLFAKKLFAFLFPLIGLFLGRSAVWLFLLYGGRVPSRVIVPLYLCEISFLLCLFFLAILNSNIGQAQTETKTIKNAYPFVPVLLLLPFAALTCISQYKYTMWKNGSEYIYFAGFEDIVDYCDGHPEKRYFIDLGSLIYYRGSAFETKSYGPRNVVVTGGWYAGAPTLYQYEKEYFSNCDNIYLIVSSAMEMQAGAVITYLEECLETSAYLEDSFTVSNGGEYLIYAFSL